MGEFMKDPGGHRVTDPGGWKVIFDPGGTGGSPLSSDPGTGV